MNWHCALMSTGYLNRTFIYSSASHRGSGTFSASTGEACWEVESSSDLENAILAIKSIPKVVRESLANVDAEELKHWKEMFFRMNPGMHTSSIDDSVLSHIHFGDLPCGLMNSRLDNVTVEDMNAAADAFDALTELRGAVITVWASDADEVDKLAAGALSNVYPRNVQGFVREGWQHFGPTVPGAMLYTHGTSLMSVLVSVKLTDDKERAATLAVTTQPEDNRGIARVGAHADAL
eukprot:GHVU01092152.1.p1 GENE.GHVU01092152.1~~GHVU01092152.1.p1  ORF type:complete len:235 (+),score=31.58 GHVU01092152.1:733-1437(+)